MLGGKEGSGGGRSCDKAALLLSIFFQTGAAGLNTRNAKQKQIKHEMNIQSRPKFNLQQ